ncbi:MAG: preprotein translocase subunit SecE [Bacteroidales bacterium]|nr:preprotein translocase subunit SecE [Bacteroidales bacterium]
MRRFVNYVKESYVELMQKVSWPTYAELQNSAIVVFVASLIIATMVFVMDMAVGVHTGGAWKGVLGYIYGMM